MDTVTDAFMPVYTEALYYSFLTGEELTGNFLKTDKPIESWLPDYEHEGLHYLPTPERIRREGLWIVKDREIKLSQTTQRPNDGVFG